MEAVESGEILAVEQPFAVELGEGLLVSGVVGPSASLGTAWRSMSGSS